MAARFPQSTSSLTWRIKPAYAGKILAIYWPASADVVHCLRTGDTATTLISRSASGAGFNADGRITGTVGGAGGVYFSHGVSGGLGVDENDNYVLGCSYYGDIFNGVTGGTWLIGAATYPDSFVSAGAIKSQSSAYTFDISPAGGGGANNAAGGNDDVRAFISMAMRHDPADGTAKFRFIANGSEVVGARANPTVSATDIIGSTGRPLKFGGTYTGTGNTSLDGEAWYVGTGLTVAEVEAITADPSIVIEVVAATPIAFTGTVPTINATVGSAGSVDLASYFSGSLTPFTYSTFAGTLPTGFSRSGSVISWTTGTVAGTTTGIQIRGTDTGSNVATTNSFDIVVAASSGSTALAKLNRYLRG